MNAIEITIRVGDRRCSDGQVNWQEVQTRQALVSGEDIESLKAEALRLAGEEMKRID